MWREAEPKEPLFEVDCHFLVLQGFHIYLCVFIEHLLCVKGIMTDKVSAPRVEYFRLVYRQGLSLQQAWAQCRMLAGFL